MKKPLLHFDVFGPVKHVVRTLEVRVPEVFSNVTGAFLENVTTLIERQADQNGWDTVAVNLTQGLARRVLDDIVAVPLAHTGPIVIDPTGNTPEYHIYKGNGQLKSAHERLIEVNEATGDILVIIYGVAELTREVQRDFLIRRVKTVGAMLDLMDGDDVAVETDEDGFSWRTPEGRKRLIEARRYAGMMLDGLRQQDLLAMTDHSGNLRMHKVDAYYLATILSIWGAAQLANAPWIKRTLEVLYNQSVNWSRDFAGLGLSSPPPLPVPGDVKEPAPGLAEEHAFHPRRSPEP